VRIWWGATPVISIASVAATAALGCANCTDVGCDPGVDVQSVSLNVPRADYVVRAGVEGTCADQRIELIRGEQSIGASLPIEADVGEVVAVDLTVERDGKSVLNATGAAVVRVTQPNGPDCEPKCRLAQGHLVGTRIEPLS